MKLISRLGLALSFSLLCAVAFGAVAVLVGTNRITVFDRTIIDGLQGLESAEWTSVMKVIGSVASGIPVVVIIAVVALYLLFIAKRVREFVLFIAVLAGSQILNLVLKTAFQRERPDFLRIIEASGYSFPSGNSVSAFALFGTLAFLLWRHIPTRAGRTILLIICSFFILAVGASRVYLGVHYPSDIIAGFLVSGFWLGCSIHVYRRISDKKVLDMGERM